ncbi:MAG: metallophosphoesterase [Mycoplasmoidaceae bacterium]|nr:MAG: metallophosphoesterase [Mycoplasmoidaceae bacterium]
MIILIISDTHGKTEEMLQILQKEKYDLAIHAGDYDNYDDDPIEHSIITKNFKYHIRGNHGVTYDIIKKLNINVNEIKNGSINLNYHDEFMKLYCKNIIEDYKEFTIDNKKFLLIHEHYAATKNWGDQDSFDAYKNGVQKIEQKVKPDFIICGHTHIAKIIKEKKIMIINPGSMVKPRYPQTTGSYILANFSKGKLTCEIKYFS